MRRIHAKRAINGVPTGYTAAARDHEVLTSGPMGDHTTTGTRAVQIAASDRLLLLAAHPDDETLAAGALLQRATAAGAGTRVVFVTDGENNPWAQRASERRVRIGAADRIRFGATRRREARSALARLGVPEACAHFLALPDQGLTRLLTTATEPACAALAPHLVAWRPTIVVAPSAADLHPDHNALAVLSRLVIPRTPADERPRELAYLVHNPELRGRAVAAGAIQPTGEEAERKRAAILRHASQLHLRGAWLHSFGSGPERFVPAPWPPGAPHPVRRLGREGDQAVVIVVTRPRPRSFGARTLRVLADGGHGSVASLAIHVPTFSGRTVVRDPRSGATVGEASFGGGPCGGEVRFPASLLAGASRAFVKLERRFGFFDEAGWLELEP
jgi:LmbE family N-acetylglucosaminyl deacetylase